MKKFITLIVIYLFFTPSWAQESFNPNELKAEYFNNEKVKDGLIFSDDKGQDYKVKNNEYARGVYIKKDDKWLKHGVFYGLYEGRITDKTVYKFGVKHGEHESYFKDGKVQFLYYYQDGKKHGKWYQYRNNGSLAEECSYQYGKKHGQRISYHGNGTQQFVCNYVEGKIQGEKLQYNEKGKLVARSHYVDGKKVGKTEWYH